MRMGRKAPPIRFKTGTRLTYESIDYLVEGCFRLADNPHEWIYVLVDMTPIVQSEALARLEEVAALARATGTTSVEGVVFAPFRSSWDAMHHFHSVPSIPGRRSDVAYVPNKKLMQFAVVTSSPRDS